MNYKIMVHYLWPKKEQAELDARLVREMKSLYLIGNIQSEHYIARLDSMCSDGSEEVLEAMMQIAERGYRCGWHDSMAPSMKVASDEMAVAMKKPVDRLSRAMFLMGLLVGICSAIFVSGLL